jgi:hypothetical protein
MTAPCDFMGMALKPYPGSFKKKKEYSDPISKK